MRIPAIPVSRWILTSNNDVYRSDGYVGIQTDSPGGLLGLADGYTYVTVDADKNLTFADINAGINTLADLLDHGLHTGLLDDDHPQYFRTDGTRVMTGNINLGGFDIVNVDSITADSLTVNSLDAISATFDGYIVPSIDDAYGLGTPDQRWNAVWVGPDSLHVTSTDAETGVGYDWRVAIDTSSGKEGELILAQSSNSFFSINPETGNIAMANGEEFTSLSSIKIPESSAPVNEDGYGKLYVSSNDTNIHYLDGYGTDYEFSLILTVTSTGYDGDPNDSLAPAALQNAQVGALYFRETPKIQYRKVYDTAFGWISVAASLAEDVTAIYVDSTNGNDAYAGTESQPIKSLFEASKRVVGSKGVVDVWLEDGYHPTEDLFGTLGSTTQERLLFHGNKAVNIRSRNSVTIKPITITSWDGYVATVSETLGANAHVGQYMQQEIFAGFLSTFFVISNTASTITFAITTTSIGGFFTPLTGSYELQVPGATIIQPATNPTFFVNRMFVDGNVTLENLTFDARINGGFVGATTFSPGAEITITKCRFFGYDQAGFNVGGSSTISASYFNGLGKSNVVGVNAFGSAAVQLTGDNVFKDITTALKASNQADVILASAQTFWCIGCFLSFEIDGGRVQDNSYWVYTGDGPYPSESYIRVDGPSFYRKVNFPIRQLNGDHVFARVVDVQTTNFGGDMLDSPSAILNGTPTYVRLGSTSFTLQEYNDFDSAVGDNLGNFVAK